MDNELIEKIKKLKEYKEYVDETIGQFDYKIKPLFNDYALGTTKNKKIREEIYG